MKVAIIGSGGLLGKELKKHFKDALCFDGKSTLDINNPEEVAALKTWGVDMVVLCAAETDNRKIEADPERAVRTNIQGTANVALHCMKNSIRLVYISTDYVYPGDRGNYKETDALLPFNLYAWTKLGGECAVRGVPNHVIIRTSFGSGFEYREAFTDKWTSKVRVNQAAYLISRVALSPAVGVVNVGTERHTIYDYAVSEHDQDGRPLAKVKPTRLRNSHHNSPFDTSLNLEKLNDIIHSDEVVTKHTCRVCGSGELVKYLDLGLMPLANMLEPTSALARSARRYPLQVMLCEACGLSQLSLVVSPEVMYSHYTYRSGVNGGYIAHCREMADWYFNHFQQQDYLHVDIAGNDGTLLKTFKEVWADHPEARHAKYQVLNVDPAENLTAIARQNGVESVTAFWGGEACALVKEKGGADLITATNVFAHVDDVHNFLRYIESALSATGIAVLEFPYLGDFINECEFDTVYFEHLSYMSLTPLYHVAQTVGLEVHEVEHQNIHGGTLRVVLCRPDTYGVTQSVTDLLEREASTGFKEIGKYTEWAKNIYNNIKAFSKQMYDLKKSGKKIAAFAASAKGNTLLNSCKITTDIIDYIVDETPEKVGRYSPGTGIPIVGIDKLREDAPDFLVILSWNFKEEIVRKVRKAGYKGAVVIPVPHVEIEMQ